jgi:coenzyme F420-0:L-glutamate ligase/coenzyme F420-1:gamma-L-glutamate ligase
MRLEIVALSTLPEVRRGDDLAALIREAANKEHQAIETSTVVAVAQKIVSKAEGAVVDLRTIQPSALAQSWAAQWGKDPRLIELILSHSRRILKMDRGILIVETRLGHVCANAGVDQSNVEGDDFATVLPSDPDASAPGAKVSSTLPLASPGSPRSMICAELWIAVAASSAAPSSLSRINSPLLPAF